MVSPSTTDLTSTGSANSMVVVVESLGPLGSSVVVELSLGSESSVELVALLCVGSCPHARAMSAKPMPRALTEGRPSVVAIIFTRSP